MEPSTVTPIRASTVAWTALGLALGHLALVLAAGSGALPAPLGALRTLLSLPVFALPGLPLALLVHTRPRDGDATVRVGAFSLLTLSIGLSLVLDLGLVEVLRAIALSVTGRAFSLAALAGAGAAAWVARRRGAPQVFLERGLTSWALLAALALVVGFAVAAHGRLFCDFTRFVAVPWPAVSQTLEREAPEDPGQLKLTIVSGARAGRGRWHRATDDEVIFKLTSRRPRRVATLLGFAVTAPLETEVQLWQVDGSACRQPGRATPALRRLATAVVPTEAAGFRLASVMSSFNTVVFSAVELPPGDSCLALRFAPWADRAPEVTFAEVSRDLFSESRWLGDDLLAMPLSTIEAHASNAAHRQRMQRESGISPSMLLWGYFSQFVIEQLAGDRSQALGASFLLFYLLSFLATLVMIGIQREAPTAAPGPRQRPRVDVAGLLLLGPLLAQLHGLTYNNYGSFTFPDAAYTFFIVAALAALMQRDRLGFILLGCLGAYARYPGAYVLAVALAARLVFYRDDRRWTRRTLLWALGAGVLVVALVLAHFHTTGGIRQLIDAAYFEVVPEHFEVIQNVPPVWFRCLCFFTKLALLSGFTLLLWPWARSAAGRFLIMVTLGYAVTLMAVHVPHAHYYPILVYGTAAAGLGAVARHGQRLTTTLALALVPVGTGLALFVEPLLRRCLGCP